MGRAGQLQHSEEKLARYCVFGDLFGHPPCCASCAASVAGLTLTANKATLLLLLANTTPPVSPSPLASTVPIVDFMKRDP